jgi:hypothetical protein
MAEHLNAQQVAQIEGKIRLAIEQAINGMNLRKWAVEQAMTLPDQSSCVIDRDALARKIYNFVVEPTEAIKVTLE